jgi:hypothetical protein
LQIGKLTAEVSEKYNIAECVLNHLENIIRLRTDASTIKESIVCERINEIIPDKGTLRNTYFAS